MTQRPALHHLRGEHARRTQVAHGLGHFKAAVLCAALALAAVEDAREPRTHLRLPRVIALVLQLHAHLLDCALQKQPAREQRRRVQQPAQVAQVGLDGLADARELYLDGDCHRRVRRVVGRQNAVVDLPNRRRRKGHVVEARKALPPVRAEVLAHHPLHLPCGHVVRAVLHLLQDALDFRRQEVAVLDREELAQLQRRTAHPAQLVHQSPHVGVAHECVWCFARRGRRRAVRRVRLDLRGCAASA